MYLDRCDYCDTYQRLGYDRCPACQPSEPHLYPAPTPGFLLEDLLDQLSRYHALGHTPDVVTISGWLILAKRIKASLAALAKDAPCAAPTSTAP